MAMRVCIIALCASLAAGAAGWAQDTSKAPDRPKVRIAVEGAYPPFNYLDQNNELQGFEPDLAKALCAAIPADCTLVPHEWDGIIRGLIDREYDAILSSLEITGRRQRRIAFSRPYYRVPSSFIALKEFDAPRTSPEALAGQRIGAVDRSPQAAFLKDLYRASEIQLYAKIEEANLDLLTNRLDLVLGDKLALSRFLETREGACCRFVADAPAKTAYFGQGVGIGFRKEDEDLRDAFDRAIVQVMKDGSYDLIRARYFAFDIR
jgi:polar amino acid transport system substrate-binding protein